MPQVVVPGLAICVCDFSMFVNKSTTLKKKKKEMQRLVSFKIHIIIHKHYCGLKLVAKLEKITLCCICYRLVRFSKTKDGRGQIISLFDLRVNHKIRYE